MHQWTHETRMSKIIDSLTCPVCSGKSFSVEEKRIAFLKRSHFACASCGTRLENAGRPASGRFKVTRVGASYSNTADLFRGMAFSQAELASTGLPVYSDEELACFARGQIPADFFSNDTPEGETARLRHGERTLLLLENVYAFDDRVQRSVKTSKRSIQTLVGVWNRVSLLPEPRWSNVTETLDRGVLWITTERYRFLGERRRVEEPLTKVKSVLLYRDGMAISRSNSPKTEYYKGSYHWPFIAALLRGMVHNIAKGNSA